MIEVRGISKRFTQGSGRSAQIVQAVENVSWTAKDGLITGLLGPNGAGKTTSLRMCAGLLTPDAGSIWVDGLSVATQRSEALARMGILSDARGLYPRLTARENILYYGELHGMKATHAKERVEVLAHMLVMFQRN